MGIVCLCCEWSHEPFANYAGTSRKRVSKSVSQGAPFWQASKANYVSGWTEKIEFFCPTKNAYLQSRVCDSMMPQNIVQDEQRGVRQRAFAAYDTAECRTKVHGICKSTKLEMIDVSLINLKQQFELTTILSDSEQRRRNLYMQQIQSNRRSTGGKLASRRAAASSKNRVLKQRLKDNNAKPKVAQSNQMHRSRANKEDAEEIHAKDGGSKTANAVPTEIETSMTLLAKSDGFPAKTDNVTPTGARLPYEIPTDSHGGTRIGIYA